MKIFYSDQLLALKRKEIGGHPPTLVDMPYRWWRWFSHLIDQRGMANFYSDQVTNIRAKPATFLKPSELVGRIRVAYFSYTTPASGAPAVADFVALTKLPRDARITDLIALWEALTSGAGVAGADFGVANDDAGTGFTADFAAALNMDAAGFKRFDPVIDKLPNVTPYTAEKYVLAKVTGEAWAVSKKVQGLAYYVLD